MNFSKRLFLFALMIISIQYHAQGCFNGGAETDLSIQELHGKVKSIHETEYGSDHPGMNHYRKHDIRFDNTTFFNEQGYICGEKDNDDGDVTSRIYSYPSSGKEIIVYEITKHGDTLSIEDHFYDNNCREWQDVTYDAHFNILEQNVFTYDSTGQLTARSTYDPSGKKVRRTEYLYTHDRHDSITISTDDQDSLIWRAVTTWSADRRSCDCHFYHRKRNEDFYTHDSTNEHGDEVLDMFYHTDKSLNFGFIYSYEYDAQGNWIKQAETDTGDDSGFYVTIREIEYRK